MLFGSSLASWTSFAMQFANRLAALRKTKKRGQMIVELAVCIPIILAVMGVALNVLGYLNVAARFDRVAADAVRSQASSPGYGQEGSSLAAERVRAVIEASLGDGAGTGFDCDVAVSASTTGWGSGSGGAGGSSGANAGISFSMLPRLERYDCSVTYHPWPFDRIVFLQFFELEHTRSYTVDPFRPGVLF